MSAAERAVAALVEAASRRLVERMGEAVPGVGAEAQPGGGVRLSGRRLARRLLDHPALRWPAGLLK